MNRTIENIIISFKTKNNKQPTGEKDGSQTNTQASNAYQKQKMTTGAT